MIITCPTPAGLSTQNICVLLLPLHPTKYEIKQFGFALNVLPGLFMVCNRFSS